MRRLTLLTLFVLLSTLTFGQHHNMSKMDSLFNFIESRNLNLGSIAISKNGKTIYQRDFGNKTTGGSYHIGSITKMFTATMFFKAAEEGKLDLNEKLSAYFPEIPNANDITISNLLNHTSGLKDYVTKDDPLLYWLKKPVTESQILEEIKRQGVEFNVGQGFKYSNSGYYLLAKILEKIEKKSYSELLNKRVINPLKLSKTSSTEDGLKINRSHRINTLGKWILIEDFYFPNVIGVGEVVSTPKELNIIIESLFAGKIVNSVSLNGMKPIDARFGRGIMRIPFHEHTFLGHGGETYGTRSVSVYNEKDQVAIGICINGESMNLDDILMAVLNIFYNKEYEFPSIAITEPQNISVKSLSNYLGEYSSKASPLKIKIVAEGDNLFAEVEKQSRLMLEAVNSVTFRNVSAKFEIVFNTAQNTLLLKQRGAEILLNR